MYLDATNLYGHSMSQCLPVSDFSWLSPEELKTFETLDFMSIADDADYGYVFEVDINYPKSLHEKHNDLPFLAENICVPDSKQSKLICNLNKKEKYVIHYRNLKQAVKNGLK